MDNLSTIHIENCQVKSKEKLKILCKCLDTMEKEFGIRSVKISFKNNFICSDINLNEFSNSDDPMEKLVGEILTKIDIKQYEQNSKYYKKRL